MTNKLKYTMRNFASFCSDLIDFNFSWPEMNWSHPQPQVCYVNRHIYFGVNNQCCQFIWAQKRLKNIVLQIQCGIKLWQQWFRWQWSTDSTVTPPKASSMTTEMFLGIYYSKTSTVLCYSYAPRFHNSGTLC